MIYKFATVGDKPHSKYHSEQSKSKLLFKCVLIWLNIIHDGADVHLLLPFDTFLSPSLFLEWFNRNVLDKIMTFWD